MRYSPGSTAPLTSTFTKGGGELIDPDDINVDVFNPAGQIVDDGTPTRLSLGFYRYEFAIPQDAPTGLYRIEWQAVINGLSAYGDEIFEVEFADINVGPSPAVLAAQLRARLAEEKTNPDGDGSETFFSDATISDLLFYAGDDLDAATLEGWIRKQARYARLVDISESGSVREMSQKFKHATEMVKWWANVLGGIADASTAALAGRVVGRPVNLRENGVIELQTPFSGYSDHIREYPTHRLLIPAILS